jgi:hypothetical protein
LPSHLERVRVEALAAEDELLVDLTVAVKVLRRDSAVAAGLLALLHSLPNRQLALLNLRTRGGAR